MVQSAISLASTSSSLPKSPNHPLLPIKDPQTLAAVKAQVDNLPFSAGGLAVLLLIFDYETSQGICSNVGCNLAGLLAHMQPENEGAVAFAKQHLLTKEENDTTCWYLFTGCFAKSEHEGVRAATVVALRELAEKLKTQSALARCEHLLAILTQEGASASRGSHEYVKTVFDDLAPVFESRLVDTLGYRVPWILHELVLEHFKVNDLMLMPEYVNKTMSILDLGCGTGLVGKCFSDFVREKSTERSILEADYKETKTQITKLQSSIAEMNNVDPDLLDSDFNDARKENLIVIEKCEEYVSVIERKMKAKEGMGSGGIYGPIKGRMLGCDISPKMCTEVR
ncbi:hypothetical protein TL16_g12045 [Triparma laevis f. inornata]|uniref:Uncharacterized protein n=1 Tax=Triparma laevis f. inornata TaxID=1714386 RepID=A0A9W7BQ62_9STRA|nr:hypothetical protein TL16_g12045 [Triparma laevis f. inornata]